MSERIGMSDTGFDMIYKMSGGNPGAIRVLTEIVSRGNGIDRDAGPMGSITPILCMDTLGIYESRIWMLFKDVCGCDLVKTLACMRGWQLGVLSDRQLKSAIDNCGDGVDVEAVLAAVKSKLPGFDRPENGQLAEQEG